MGCIYKITNKVNGKVYIGQTIRTVQTRWKQHIQSAFREKNKNRSPLLYNAIRKYGADSFEIVELEKCSNNILDEREIYWIKQYDSYKNGYNCTIGGRGNVKCFDEEILKLWNDGLSVKQISNKLHLTYHVISLRLQNVGISQESINERMLATASRTKGKPIYQYDIDGNFIQGFESAREAKIHIGRGKIKCTPTKRYKTLYGYQWKFYKADKIDSVREELENVQSHKKKVHQYTMEGEYVRSYDSIVEAERMFGREYGSAICIACKGKIPSAYGFRWSKERYDTLKTGVSF